MYTGEKIETEEFSARVEILGSVPSCCVAGAGAEAGERVIPLNADAWNTVLSLYRRVQGFGEVRPEHYGFPRLRSLALRPYAATDKLRTAWRNLTRQIQCAACGRQQGPSEACGNPECKADLKKVKSPRAGLRFHDLAPCDHRACRIAGQRQHGHGNCRARLSEDAGALLPRKTTGEANRPRRALHEAA